MEQNITTLDDFKQILLRRKWSIILPAVIIFAVSALLVALLPRTYKSTSTILIEAQVIPQEFVATTVTSYAEQRLQSINQRVMSTTKLMEIMNRFKLYPELKSKWTTEQLVDKMRKDIKMETISADVRDPHGSSKVATIAFTLSYRGEKPAVVQEIANMLASLYLEENLKVREQQTSETTKFLEEEMNSVQAGLAELDRKIAVFKRKNLDSLPEVSQVNLQGADRLENDIDRMNEQLRSLKEREGYLQTQLAASEGYSYSVSGGRLIELREQLQLRELRTRLENLKSLLPDDHPDVVRVKNEIAEMEKQHSNSVHERAVAKSDNPVYIALDTQLAGTRSEIESVKRQIELVGRKKDGFHRRFAASPRVEEGYKALSMQRNSMQLKLDDLMKKYMEAKVAHGLEREQMSERFTIIDVALLPEKPISPNVPAIFLIGLVLGVGSGAGLAAVKEFCDQSVRSPEALTKATGFTVLAGIPEIVTREQAAGSRTMWTAVIIGVVFSLVVAVLIFHFFFMDLDILWAKLSRRIGV